MVLNMIVILVFEKAGRKINPAFGALLGMKLRYADIHWRGIKPNSKEHVTGFL